MDDTRKAIQIDTQLQQNETTIQPNPSRTLIKKGKSYRMAQMVRIRMLNEAMENQLTEKPEQLYLLPLKNTSVIYLGIGVIAGVIASSAVYILGWLLTYLY